LTRHRDLPVREGGAADRGEVDRGDPMVRHPEVVRDPLRGLDLLAVPLAVVEGERNHDRAIRRRHREGGGGVHASGQEDHRSLNHDAGMERESKGLASDVSESEPSDHPLVSIDEGGHASVTDRPFAGFFQEANLVALRVVQVRHATVRPIGGRPQELGSPSGQFGVDLGEVVHAEHEETFGGLPAVPRWAPMDGKPDRPRIEVDHMALVEEEYDGLHGERHEISPWTWTDSGKALSRVHSPIRSL